MNNSIKIALKYWFNAILGSYSQLFFSLNKVLAIVIIIATFFTPHLGLTGLSAVVLLNVTAYLVGINRKMIEEGLFGFNAMLLGLFLGDRYQINETFWLLLVVSVFFLLITSVWLNSMLGKHSLPFLSIPFILTSFVIVLAVGNFSKIHLNEDNVYIFNHLATQQKSAFYQFVHQFDHIHLPKGVIIYFKIFAGTFFQKSLLAGIIISLALLYFSRIAFTLSVLGFTSAYYFLIAFGADVNELDLNLVGSNFIFMSIAIGCFFLIPNIYSYIAVIVLTPIVMLLVIFFNKILIVFQLNSFTLAFCVVVILFLLFLHHRWFHKFLHLVTIQYYSAEKTIYKHITTLKRFSSAHLAKVSLPFWGEWYVSQGYNGKITHLGEWGRALDFVIVDDERKTFQNAGNEKDDFYCYNKPVVAPMDGYIYDIINTVEDNEITGVNTDQNWGNSIILNHANGLFTQLSHIKKDSFKVAIGEYITKGTVLATCGNSGRSPEPHIHFQLQVTPTLGAVTLAYPIAYFIEGTGSNKELKTFEIPKEETIISNINVNSILADSFYLYPGKKINLTSEEKELIQWEVFTDQINRTYLYCHSSKSIAYFVNDGTMFYFFDFEGDKKSLLFQFYLAAYRILLGCYENLPVADSIPLIHFNHPIVQWIQDFFAPFYLFTKTEYVSTCVYADNLHDPKHMKIASKITSTFFQQTFKELGFEIELKENKITQLSVTNKGTKKIYICD